MVQSHNHPFDIIERRPKHDQTSLYAASNTDRHIYRLHDGDTDAGDAITARLRTGHLARSSGKHFSFRLVRVRATGAGEPSFDLKLTAHRDGTTQCHEVASAKAGLPATMHGEAIDVDLSVTPDNGPVTVHGLDIERIYRRSRAY